MIRDVYVSPDGEREQFGDTPANVVRLRYAGWTRKPEAAPVEEVPAAPKAKKSK